MPIKTHDIAQDGLFGYLAQPQSPHKGGVLIVPTIFAVNPFVRGFADELARAGLTAAVCDLYSGLPLVTGYEESVARARKLDDRLVETITGRWLDYLQRDCGLTSLGILGFCLGGRYALLRAARDPCVKACAAAYPSIEVPMLSNQSEDVLKLAGDITAPVHLCEPGIDHVTSAATYGALKEALLRRSAVTIVQYHPEAEHGFMHRKEPPSNPAATAIAAPQVVAFLAACLN